MSAVFIEILNMSFTAAIVACAVMLARLPLKKAPKVFSYALWAVVLFRLVCPVTIESAVSLMPGSAKPVPQSIVTTHTPAIQSNIAPVDNAVNSFLASNVPIDREPAESPAMRGLMDFGTFVWLAGMTFMLGYALLGYMKLKRRLKTAVMVRDNIYETDCIVTPFVLGFIKPKIYLPIGMEDTDYILKHEQTHIRRLDYLVKPVVFLALCLHWFNPVIWLSYYLMCKDMEMSCDESVLRRSEEDIRGKYSGSLLSLSVKQSGLLSPLAFGESNTRTRIKNVLSYKKPAFWISVLAVIAVLGLTVGFAANRAHPGITTEASVDQLIDSIEYANGDIRFQIPADYLDTVNWNIHISGRAEYDDGMSMSVHEFEDVNDAHAWEAGKWYSIPFEGRHLTELTMDVTLPGDNGAAIEKSVDLLEGVRNLGIMEDEGGILIDGDVAIYVMGRKVVHMTIDRYNAWVAAGENAADVYDYAEHVFYTPIGKGPDEQMYMRIDNYKAWAAAGEHDADVYDYAVPFDESMQYASKSNEDLVFAYLSALFTDAYAPYYEGLRYEMSNYTESVSDRNYSATFYWTMYFLGNGLDVPSDLGKEQEVNFNLQATAQISADGTIDIKTVEILVDTSAVGAPNYSEPVENHFPPKPEMPDDSYLWPLDGYAEISAQFGTRTHPVEKTTVSHEGIDIATPAGTPIFASKAGAVVEAGENDTDGLYVLLSHGAGVQTFYAHMNEFAEGIANGEPVERGDVIGYVGSTGESTGSHLHFGISVDGVYINPSEEIN